MNYSGAAAGDSLLLTYSVTTDNGANMAFEDYIGIQAAALQGSAVPEPATLAVFGLAFVAFARRRRVHI